MEEVSFTDFRANLKHYLDMVEKDNKPVRVNRKTRSKSGNVVLIPLTEYERLTARDDSIYIERTARRDEAAMNERLLAYMEALTNLTNRVDRLEKGDTDHEK